MTTIHTRQEAWDRLALLLIAQPREGWEEIYEEITRREVLRLAPHPEEHESNEKGPNLLAEEPGRTQKGRLNGIIPQ
jgi:hypothetical protein